MTNARPVDDDFLGSFSSASELERQFPAAHRSGMTATVTDGTTEHPYATEHLYATVTQNLDYNFDMIFNGVGSALIWLGRPRLWIKRAGFLG